MVTRFPVRARGRAALAGALCLAVAFPLFAQPVAAPPLEPEASRWLGWLGPVAPRHIDLPPIPTVIASPGHVWTVEEVLARALRSNPDVQVALAQVERHDGLRLQNVASLLPRIGISASRDWRDKALIDRSVAEEDSAAIGGGLTPIATRGYDARVEIRQTLFDGLASWHQVRRAALLEKKASLDARELYLRLASQVRQAYDAVLYRKTVVATRREAVGDLSRLADSARRRFAAGGIGEFESLRAATALSAAEADLAKAEAELSRAEELLCRIIYVEKPANGLELAGTLTAKSVTEPFEIALRRAQANRLDLRSAQLELDAARMGLRAAAAGFAPRIEAFVGYGYRSSYYDADRELEGWTAGIVGRWDIFDSGRTVGAMRTQKAERRIAEIRVAGAQHLIGSQVRELYSALEQSEKVLASHVAARDLGERSKREATAALELGRGSPEQVIDAELMYRQAYIGWLGEVYSRNATVYQLDYASANEAFLDAAVAAQP